MMKELTQEQINQLGERMRNAAGNAAESSLPLMIRDLGKQLAESGDNKLDATLKIGLELNDGEWVISTAMEWTRKMKHKDAFDDVRVNFEQPELPLEDAESEGAGAIDDTARKLDAGGQVRMLGAGELHAPNHNPLCKCGHVKSKHYGDDKGTDCQECSCDAFEVSDDADAANANTNPDTGLSLVCECGHLKSQHAGNNCIGDCVMKGCDCEAFKLYVDKPAEPTDPDFHMADEADAANARDARNARKLAAKGFAAAYLGTDEKTVFLAGIGSEKFDALGFTTKASAKRKLEDLYDGGVIRFNSLVRDFEALSGAGFTMVIRVDEASMRIRYTDMSHNWATLLKFESRDSMAAHLAGLMADPNVLED